MSQLSPSPIGGRPVPGREVRIESVGVCGQPAQGMQAAVSPFGYVDVAVDLTPTSERIRVELAVEEPSGAELVSMTLIDNCQPMLDRRLHLRRPPEPGVHTLHVGVFCGDDLIDHVQKCFSFSVSSGEIKAGSPQEQA